VSVVRAAAAAAVVVLVFASPAAAAPEDVANDVAAKVMSPFCPGVTLHDCPSAEATALIDRIERWARDGMTEEQIVNALEAQYGVGIRSTPPAGDGGWLAWALPGAGLLAGLALGWLLLRRLTTGATREAERGAEAERGPVGSDELGERDRARLERELAMLRGER
jgi:cytochrome c-type biogenesis protein CcmH/NrfF